MRKPRDTVSLPSYTFEIPEKYEREGGGGEGGVEGKIEGGGEGDKRKEKKKSNVGSINEKKLSPNISCDGPFKCRKHKQILKN